VKKFIFQSEINRRKQNLIQAKKDKEKKIDLVVVVVTVVDNDDDVILDLPTIK